MAYIYDLTDTWNAGGTTFYGIKMNVTNTASASGSKLLSLQVGGAEQFGVDKDGNVGVGTSSPSAKLSVVGTAKIGEGAASNSAKLMVNTVSGAAAGIQLFQDGNESWIIQNPASTTALTFANSGTERMRIDSSGNVGIGTSAPGVKLDVWTPNGTATTVRWAQTGVTNYDWRIPASTDAFTLNYGGSTERMRIDSSGNVGIGTTSPSRILDVRSASPTIRIQETGSGGDKRLELSVNASAEAKIAAPQSGSVLIFDTVGSERARIDSSGNLLVGTTSTNPTNGFVANANSGSGFYTQTGHPDGTVSGVAYARYMYNQTEIGSVTQSGTTAVLYNTSSDARLKHDIVDAPEASSLIDAIKVRSFKWNADNSDQRYGFVAQELLPIAPEAVSQPEDPEQMMGVDYSKLVPMLVKEIQSLRARVAQLEGN